MVKINKNISIIGLGKISPYLCKSLISMDAYVTGVTSNKSRVELLSKLGVKVFNKNEIMKSIKFADSLIITVPPDANGCPIINKFGKNIIKSNISWLGYLSSTSVYGNHNGAIINEETLVKPTEKSAVYRHKAENDVLKLASTSSINAEIFRVSGIYGPENNIFNRILNEKINIINKEKHYFNRIHVDDIARVLSLASCVENNKGIVNLSDNLPAPQIDVIRYAYSILNTKIPKISEYEDIKHTLKPSLKKFWENNKKIDNNLLNIKYGPLKYPTYKEGLKNIYNLLGNNREQ